MQSLTVGSLFSGIGGIDLGLQRAGFEIKWQVEIDEYCQKVLAKHWPDVARYGDIRNVGKHNLEPVDLICGGFPCQPHSLAGKRQASDDERDLWSEFYRLICELKPSWILAENVPGLLSSEDGRFFGRILRDLAQERYDAQWQSLPANAFGAPHIRERVFIVAYPKSKQDRRYSSDDFSPTLLQVLLTLPTPTSNDYKGSGHKRYRGSKHFRGAKISEALRTCYSDPIYPNPLFVEIVMGYPISWTDLEDLETPSCHKSPSTLDDAS